MTGQAIKLENAAIHYGDASICFNLAIATGAITAVIGPSGAGKSTLLNLVAGFEQLESGRIVIGGDDVTREDPATRPISMVFQENNLFSHLDVETNVALGIRPSLSFTVQDRSSVSTALNRVGLDGFEKRMPGTLSGGERSRVAIARALVRRKSILLLDEPFAALGPRLRGDMLELVRALQQELEMTVLLVTHQPEDAVSLADNIVFLDKGSAVATGPADGFLDRIDIPGLIDYLGHRDEHVRTTPITEIG